MCKLLLSLPACLFTSTSLPIGYFGATIPAPGINDLPQPVMTRKGLRCIDTVEVRSSRLLRPTTFQRTYPHSVIPNLATCVYKFARIFQLRPDSLRQSGRKEHPVEAGSTPATGTKFRPESETKESA